MLGTKGCIGLITGISNLRSTTLKTLDISTNQIGQDLVEGDVQILHALAQQFKACATFKKISFHGNFFDEKVKCFPDNLCLLFVPVDVWREYDAFHHVIAR